MGERDQEGRWLRLWHWLTRPSYALRDPTERWRAQFFAATAIIGLAAGVITACGRALVSEAVPSTLIAMQLGGVAFWALCYALTRSSRYRLGMRLLCIGAITAALGAMAIRHDPWHFAHVGLVVATGGLMLGRRDALLLSSIALVGLFVVSQEFGGPPRGDVAMMGVFIGLILLLLGLGGAFQRRLDRQRQAAIEASEARYRGLFELAFDGVVFVRHGRILESNRGFSRITGRPRSELEGRSLDEVLDITGLARDRTSLTSSETAVREGRGKKPDGRPYYVELVSRPQETDGRIAECIAVRDITERKHAELQLSIAHRAVSLGTLAAGVAHEINNPLAWVRTNIETVGECLADTLGPHWRKEQPQLADALNDAMRGVDRVELIVRDLGVLSRDDQESGTAEVTEALDLAVRMAGKHLEARARLVRDFHEVPLVRGNPSRLGQVFLNLLTNAAQAFEHADPERNEVVLRTRLEDDVVVVEVSDNASGIDPEALPHVFDPFFTTKTSGAGTGLGLPISRSIVHGVGGRMSVRSEVGLGTTFVVELRVSSEAAEAPPKAPARRETGETPRPSRVLVIDDEPLVGASLVRALREHEVVYCQHGADAVKEIEDAAFDLVLCDLMMPDMTGEEVYDAAPAAVRERFVFMTGGAFTPEARAFLERTPNAVLAKPFSTKDLRALVSDMSPDDREKLGTGGSAMAVDQ